MITKEKALDILDRMDFFQGQRAGRELWNEKSRYVQEIDLQIFREDVAELKAYIADVVPKSEADKAYARGFERGKKANVCGFSAEEIAQKAENLAIELDAMRGAANSYKMHYENERQEVARAICCEIEKEIVAALESNYRALKEWDDGRCNDYILEMVNRVKGKIDALRGIEGFVEELKKKYTEGKYENQN